MISYPHIRVWATLGPEEIAQDIWSYDPHESLPPENPDYLQVIGPARAGLDDENLLILRRGFADCKEVYLTTLDGGRSQAGAHRQQPLSFD